MHSLRRLAAATAVALSAISVTSPATATTTALLGERECTEVTFPRALDLAETRALVPTRYDLTTVTGPGGVVAARMWVYSYTCDSLTVDGVPAQGVDRPSTVSIGAVEVTARDGVPVEGFATYVVWYATDNPVAFAHLRAVGWPAQHLAPQTEATLQHGAPGGRSTVAWSVRAPGLDYDLRAISTEPVPTPDGGEISFFHDARRGDLEMVVHNEVLATAPSMVQGDLRGADLLPDLLFNPANALIPVNVGINDDGIYSPPSATFIYARGSWTSEVTRYR
jgi:hypothetical protein